MITLSRVPQMKGFPQIIKQKPLQNCNDTCSHFAAWLPSCTTSCSTQFTSLWQGFRTLFVSGQSNQCQIKVIVNILNEEKLIQQLSYDYKTIHTQTEMQQQKNCEVKLHNSFSIGGVDITRHANSPGRTQNEHFSERNALSTQNSIKTSKKNNSNMAYNDSWSTWEQKGRAEPRREKNTWRVKTTRRTCGRGPSRRRPAPAR